MPKDTVYNDTVFDVLQIIIRRKHDRVKRRIVSLKVNRYFIEQTCEVFCSVPIKVLGYRILQVCNAL